MTLLKQFLRLEFPPEKVSIHTFLDVSGIQFRETSISKIYCYFLDRNNNKVISDLFLESLIETINSKTDILLKFEDLSLFLEYQSDKGNFIDLVISSFSIDETEKLIHDNAIIIENKIFSSLNNDLLDYYNSIKARNKIGVLLTVFPHEIPENVVGSFINITHSEWISKVKNKGIPSNLTAREYIYLTDFINNMENLTQSEEMNDDVKFFFTHTNKILRAIETRDSAEQYILNQLKILSERIGMGLWGNSKTYRHIWDKNIESQVYFAIVYDRIFTPKPEITVFLEVYKDAILREKDLRVLLKEKSVYNHLNDDEKVTPHWAHLAYKTYHLETEQLANLSDYLFQKLNEEFMEAYKLVAAIVNK